MFRSYKFKNINATDKILLLEDLINVLTQLFLSTLIINAQII